jgi:hypothetical protein
MSAHDLAALSHRGAAVLMLGRKELQRLAKKHGIKANVSSEAIVNQLLELRAKGIREEAAADAAPRGASPTRGPAVALPSPSANDASSDVSQVSSLRVGVAEETARQLNVTQLTGAEADARSAAVKHAASLPALPIGQPSDPAAQSSVPSRALASSAHPLPAQTHRQANPEQLGAAAAPRRSSFANAGVLHSSPSPARLLHGGTSASSCLSGRPQHVPSLHGVRHGAANPAAASSPARSGATPSSTVKRKSPGFMAPLRRHSSVDSGYLKRQSSGALRTPIRAPRDGENQEPQASVDCPIPGVDPALVKNILGEVVLSGQGVSWDDIGTPL